MSAEEDLRAALLGDTDVTTLVGTRINPDAADQGTATPYIVYQRIETETVATIHGGIAASRVKIQLACCATSRNTAEDLADKCVEAVMPSNFYVTGRAGDFIAETETYVSVVDLQKWT